MSPGWTMVACNLNKWRDEESKALERSSLTATARLPRAASWRAVDSVYTTQRSPEMLKPRSRAPCLLEPTVNQCSV
jgi:hypothetical protein